MRQRKFVRDGAGDGDGERMESHVYTTLPVLLRRALRAVDSVDGYLGLFNISSTSRPSIISSSVSAENVRDMESVALQTLALKVPELRPDDMERRIPIVLTRTDEKDNLGFAGCDAILLAMAGSYALVLGLRDLRHHRSSEQIVIDLREVSELSMQVLDSLLMHRWCRAASRTGIYRHERAFSRDAGKNQACRENASYYCACPYYGRAWQR